MEHNNNLPSFDRSVHAIADRRRTNSDFDYFFELPQVSIDTSESLLSSFELEGFADPLAHSACRMDSNTNSPHHHERIHVIKNILEKGLDAGKISALEELSSLLKRDRSISLRIDYTFLDLLSSNLSSDTHLCLLSANCLGALAEFSSYIRDHLFEFGTFHTLHALIDTLQDKDAEAVSKACTLFLRSETLPSLSLTKKVLFDLERHIKIRYTESNPGTQESIPSILVSLRTISYFSKDPQSDVANFLCKFTAFISSLVEHQDEHVLQEARAALKLMMSLQDKCMETPNKEYDIELPSPENRLMPPLLWRPMSSCEISPDSPAKKSAKDWNVSPIITSSTQNATTNFLWEGDKTICQNIEIFIADERHARNEDHVFPGQIGLRCMHCKSSPFKKMPFFMVFPAELSMIAPNLRHIAKDHLMKCLNLSPIIRTKLSTFLQQDSLDNISYASALESFCSSICSKYGLVDSFPIGTGLCLLNDQKYKKTRSVPPNQAQAVVLDGDISNKDTWDRSPLDCNQMTSFYDLHHASRNDSIVSSKSEPKLNRHTTITNATGATVSNSMRTKDSPDDVNLEINSSESSEDLVYIRKVHSGKSNMEILIGNDRDMITDHLALTLEQMQICYFDKSSDQKSIRDFKDGFPGLECIHCKGKASRRQFFWSTAYRFVNSSTEFSKHLLSCKYCPDDVKNQLILTKNYHKSQCKSLPLGTLTAFFHRLYCRLFGDIEDIQSERQPLDLHTVSSPNEIDLGSRSCSQTKVSNKIVLHVSADDKWLTENEILLRKSIEVFTISIEDRKAIQNKWPGSKVSINQVYFRCLYCSSHNDMYSDKSSFFFSAGIEKIRPDAYRFQNHLKQCPNAPDSVKKCFMTPIPYTHAKEKTHMWKQSAESLGLFTYQNQFGGNIIKTNSLGEPRFKTVATSPISQQDVLDDSFNLSNISMETSESELSIDRRKRSFDCEASSPSPKVQKVAL